MLFAEAALARIGGTFPTLATTNRIWTSCRVTYQGPLPTRASTFLPNVAFWSRMHAQKIPRPAKLMEGAPDT